MNNPLAEELELLTADQHLVEARQRLAELETQLRRQRDLGTVSVEGEQLLHVMHDVMETMTLHRELLRREVERQRMLSSEGRGW